MLFLDIFNHFLLLQIVVFQLSSFLPQVLALIFVKKIEERNAPNLASKFADNLGTKLQHHPQKAN